MNNNEKKRVINIRRCVSCYEMKPKDTLFRIVRQSDNKMIFDVSGKLDGRGAYVCKNEKCIFRAIKENRFARVLKAVSEQDIKEILERELRQGGLLDGDHQ